MVLTRFPLRQGAMAAIASTLLAFAAAPPAVGVSQRAAVNTAPANSGPSFKIKRAKDGLFYLPASLSGTSIRFLVDTGANRVVLSGRDARAIGINVESLHFSGRMDTAAGTVRTATTLLDGLEIDGHRFDHVAVTVMDRDDGISLLGQDMLARMGTIVLNRDGMQLYHRA
jgi:aspartyl protease family protein